MRAERQPAHLTYQHPRRRGGDMVMVRSNALEEKTVEPVLKVTDRCRHTTIDQSCLHRNVHLCSLGAPAVWGQASYFDLCNQAAPLIRMRLVACLLFVLALQSPQQSNALSFSRLKSLWAAWRSGPHPPQFPDSFEVRSGPLLIGLSLVHDSLMCSVALQSTLSSSTCKPEHSFARQAQVSFG